MRRHPTPRPLACIPALFLFAAGLPVLRAAEIPSCTEASPCEVEVIADRPYYTGAEASPEKHKLDLYLPRGLEAPPIMVWIHGGAWVKGDRREEEALARRFAERGLAVAAISYRLSPGTWIDPALTEGVVHPAHAEDCARAVAWVHANASRYGYDPDRMILAGYSAGGHLSALLAADPSYLRAVGLSTSDLKAAVPIAGAYDLEAYYTAHFEENGQAMADNHVKGVFGDGVGDLRSASPTSYLSSIKIPVLVVAESQTRPYTSTFQRAAMNAGQGLVEFLYLDDETHRSLWLSLSREGPSEPRQRILDWVMSQFRDAPAPKP